MEDHDDGDSDAEMADYGTDFSDDVDPNFDASTVVTVVYQGTLESGIGSPVFPVLGGISRFPIPEWPGIGNRETGRFPFGREPGIGVPIRRAGDSDFLVCSVRKWKTSPRCRSVAVAAQLAPSVAAAPLAGACRCPSQAPPGNRNPGRAFYGFCKLTLAIHMGPVLLAAAVKNVRHATAPTLRATEPAPSPGVRVDLQGRQAGASS